MKYLIAILFTMFSLALLGNKCEDEKKKEVKVEDAGAAVEDAGKTTATEKETPVGPVTSEDVKVKEGKAKGEAPEKKETKPKKKEEPATQPDKTPPPAPTPEKKS